MKCKNSSVNYCGRIAARGRQRSFNDCFRVTNGRELPSSLPQHADELVVMTSLLLSFSFPAASPAAIKKIFCLSLFDVINK